jgi:hypothetical protein
MLMKPTLGFDGFLRIKHLHEQYFRWGVLAQIIPFAVRVVQTIQILPSVPPSNMVCFDHVRHVDSAPVAEG